MANYGVYFPSYSIPAGAQTTVETENLHRPKHPSILRLRHVTSACIIVFLRVFFLYHKVTATVIPMEKNRKI